MRKRKPVSLKILHMIEQGYSNKEIRAKLKVKPQAVYQIRYQLNKAKGLGAIGVIAPPPTEGIGTPPTKQTRKVRAGTGINSSAIPDPLDNMSAKNKRPLPGEWVEVKELPITMIEKPTLWQRIVRFFKG